MNNDLSQERWAASEAAVESGCDLKVDGAILLKVGTKFKWNLPLDAVLGICLTKGNVIHNGRIMSSLERKGIAAVLCEWVYAQNPDPEEAAVVRRELQERWPDANFMEALEQ